MLHLILSLANWTAFGLVVLSQFQVARAVKGTRPRYLWSTALRISSYLLIVVWLATASVSIATGNFIHAALALGMGCFWMWVESSREKDDDMFTGLGAKIAGHVKSFAAGPQPLGSET
jgi:hypothetical protein